MNKLLLTSVLLFTCLFTFSQENGGFEIWDETPTFSYPDIAPSNYSNANDQLYWTFGLTPVTEVAGISGSGLRMETTVTDDDVIAGYAIWGDAPEEDDLIFLGGFPFTDMSVSGISVAMRYDIDVTSPGFVLVQFQNNGELVTGGQDGAGNYFFEISGTQATWETMTFNFDMPLTSVPDHCSIIFASNDILDDPSTGFAGNYLEIDNVILNGTMQLTPGGNLDTWIDNPPIVLPADWEVLYSPEYATFEQSTDAYEGSYSLKLNTLLSTENDTVVSAAYQGTTTEDGVIANVPLPDDSETLDFWYKYNSVGGDQAFLFLVLSDDIENDAEGLVFIPYFVDATADWTMGSFNFSAEALDYDFQYYAVIAFSSPIDDLGAAHPGSELWLDAFNFNLTEGTCTHDPGIIGEPGILCPDEIATLSTEQWDSYQWYQQLGDFGEPLLIEGETGQAFDVDGTYSGYSVWCETTSESCTESTFPILIDGHVFAPVVISGQGTTELCEGESTELTITGDPFESYQWFDDGTEIMGATSSSYTVSETGSFTVIVTAEECPNYEMTNGISFDITSHPIPEPVISQDGGALTLSETYNDYQWYLDGNTINGAAGSSYNAAQDGDYYVVVSDAWGCEGTSDVVTVIIDNINNFTANNFTLYPNPASSLLNIEFVTKSVNNNVTILDLTGKIVYQKATSLSKLSLDVTAYSTGVYFVQVSNQYTSSNSKITIR